MRQASFRISSIYPTRNVTDRMFHRKRHRLMQEWQQAAGAEIRRAAPEPFPGRVRVDLLICFTAERRRDRDNYQPKWLMDCLVRSGLIKDDNARIVDGPHVEFEAGHEREGIIVRITDAEEQNEKD